MKIFLTLLLTLLLSSCTISESKVIVAGTSFTVVEKLESVNVDRYIVVVNAAPINKKFFVTTDKRTYNLVTIGQDITELVRESNEPSFSTIFFFCMFMVWMIYLLILIVKP